jgi:hypothetical protein
MLSGPPNPPWVKPLTQALSRVEKHARWAGARKTGRAATVQRSWFANIRRLTFLVNLLPRGPVSDMVLLTYAELPTPFPLLDVRVVPCSMISRPHLVAIRELLSAS